MPTSPTGSRLPWPAYCRRRAQRGSPSATLPGRGPTGSRASTSRGRVELVRNEEFALWSADARPDGFADEIDFRVADKGETRRPSSPACSTARGDLMIASGLFGGPLSPERIAGLGVRHADLLHSDRPAAGRVDVPQRPPAAVRRCPRAPGAQLRDRPAPHRRDRRRAGAGAAEVSDPHPGPAGLRAVLPIHARSERRRHLDRPRRSQGRAVDRGVRDPGDQGHRVDRHRGRASADRAILRLTPRPAGLSKLVATVPRTVRGPLLPRRRRLAHWRPDRPVGLGP